VAIAVSTQLVVVGAGAGGLATAIAASEMGLEVTVVEEGLMGGDKLNYSCVPSKAVLQCTHASEQVSKPFPSCTMSIRWQLLEMEGNNRAGTSPGGSVHVVTHS
jgi:pyruvate/2-oxoglutarate dehydrogenase complex dihydrolipoamide dehydrogenase (E3) component